MSTILKRRLSVMDLPLIKQNLTDSYWYSKFFGQNGAETKKQQSTLAFGGGKPKKAASKEDHEDEEKPSPDAMDVDVKEEDAVADKKLEISESEVKEEPASVFTFRYRSWNSES